MSINDLMIMTQSDAALFFGIGETCDCGLT